MVLHLAQWVALSRATMLSTPISRTSVITSQIRVGPYEHLRRATMEECLQAAPFFCDQLQRPDEIGYEIYTGLAALLASTTGARSFFVTWNNDADFASADQSPPPQALLSALDEACAAPGPSRFYAQTLLMNIAMPVAAATAASGDADAERAAMRSYKRAAILAGYISACEGGATSLPNQLREQARAFAETITSSITGGGDEQDASEQDDNDFSWSKVIASGGYDAAQLEAIANAITLSAPDGSGKKRMAG